VGRPALRFLRGGDDVTGATLTRFFGFHVAVLPAMATALITVHVLLVQLHGMSVPPKLIGQPVKKMKFVPNFLLRDLIGWILAIGVLAALAALFPWELGEKADAFAPAPAGIKRLDEALQTWGLAALALRGVIATGGNADHGAFVVVTCVGDDAPRAARARVPRPLRARAARHLPRGGAREGSVRSHPVRRPGLGARCRRSHHALEL